MRVASGSIRTDVPEFEDRSFGVAGGSASTLNRRPEGPNPATTGSEPNSVRVTDSYDAFASPTGVSHTPALKLPGIRPGWNLDLAETGVVYYLQRSNGDIKIGTTIRYPDRRTQLGQRHGPLVLAALEPGYFALEAHRHRQFADLRVDPIAEWFRPGDDLIDHILLILALR